jgi:hypothetical protein
MEKHKTRWPLTVLLIGWSASAIGAAISHLFMPEWTAQGTTWPSSTHWQQEIACFDLLLSSAFIWIARQEDVSLKIKACGAISCLSLALGLNHLGGWLVEPKIFHLIFTSGNFFALVWGVSAIYYEKKR